MSPENLLNETSDSFLQQAVVESHAVNEVPPSREAYLISHVTKRRIELLSAQKFADSVTDNYERKHYDSLLRATPELKCSPNGNSKSLIKLMMHENHVTPVWSESEISEAADDVCGKTEMTIDINQDPHLFLEKQMTPLHPGARKKAGFKETDKTRTAYYMNTVQQDRKRVKANMIDPRTNCQSVMLDRNTQKYLKKHGVTPKQPARYGQSWMEGQRMSHSVRKTQGYLSSLMTEE